MRPVMLLALLAACTGGADSADSGAPGGSFPADSSVEGITAFIAGGDWQRRPWVAETDAPREESSVASPHDRVQVFLNDVLVASQRAGNGVYQGEPHETGSMAVKRMVDEDDALVGVAAMLKLEGDAQQWAYWCEGPAARCGTTWEMDPYYGVAYDAECAFCHGGLVFNVP